MTHDTYADLRNKLNSVQHRHNLAMLQLLSTNNAPREILYQPLFLNMKEQIDRLEAHMLIMLNNLTQMIGHILSSNDSANNYTAAFKAFFDLDTWAEHYSANVESKIVQYVNLIQQAAKVI